MRLAGLGKGQALFDLLAEALAVGTDAALQLEPGLLHGGHGGQDLCIQLGEKARISPSGNGGSQSGAS
eukprot:8895998-Pyramimonas_sp.AAC.1